MTDDNPTKLSDVTPDDEPDLSPADDLPMSSTDALERLPTAEEFRAVFGVKDYTPLDEV